MREFSEEATRFQGEKPRGTLLIPLSTVQSSQEIRMKTDTLCATLHPDGVIDSKQ